MKNAKHGKRRTVRTVAAAWVLMSALCFTSFGAKAATALNSDNFDSKTYADTYADLKAAFGYDHNMLWKHYQMFGAQEQRKVYATNGDVGYLATAQTAATPAAQTAAAAGNAALVPLSEIKKMPTFSRHMNDAEIGEVYEILKPVAEQLTGLSRKDQVKAIVRYVAKVPYRYSMSVQHCYDPYGLLVNGYASCTGHTRTVGFLLTLLGIPYQHINEERYMHQWARVQIDGVWYCCDGQVGLMMEETAPGAHPALPGKTLYTDKYGNYCVG